MPRISCGCENVNTHIVRCFFPKNAEFIGKTEAELVEAWNKANQKTKDLDLIAIGVDPDKSFTIKHRLSTLVYQWTRKENGIPRRSSSISAANKDDINDALRILSEYETVCSEIVKTENKLEKLKADKERYAPAIRALQLIRESVEDTDLSIRILKDGLCTILFNSFLAEKAQTMTMKGGNTDELYKDDGRLKMAESLKEQHPDIVKVTEKWGRPQHHVDYKVFKFNKLKLKAGIEIPEGANDYGMSLKILSPNDNPT